MAGKATLYKRRTEWGGLLTEEGYRLIRINLFTVVRSPVEKIKIRKFPGLTGSTAKPAQKANLI